MGKCDAGAMGRTFLALVVASTVALVASPAHASGSVTIGKVPTHAANYKSRVTVKPVVSAKGNARVLAKTITVTSKGKTVVRSKKSARLKAGKYKLTTQVRYQTYRWVTGTEVLRSAGTALSPTVDGKLGFGDCTVTEVSDATEFSASCALVGAHEKSLDVSSAYLVGEFGEVSVAQVIAPQRLTLPRAIHRGVRSRVFSAPRTAKRRQSLTVKQGPKPASCASPARLKEVKKSMTVGQVKVLLGKSKVQARAGKLVNREYRPCKRSYYIIVTFENGKVVSKKLYKL